MVNREAGEQYLEEEPAVDDISVQEKDGEASLLIPNHIHKDEEGINRRSSICRLVHVSAIMILFLAAMSVYLILNQQYLYSRIYLEHFPNDTDNVNQPVNNPCLRNKSHTKDNKTLEEIQSETTIFTLYVSLGLSVPAIFVNLVLGSYSDVLGRRFLFYTALTGHTVKNVIYAVVIFFNLDIYLLIIANVAEGLTGGTFAVLLTGFAYVSDITPPEKSRTVRIAVLEAAYGISVALTQFAAGYVIKYVGFFYPVIGSLVLTLAGFILTCFLPETVIKGDFRTTVHKKSPLQHLKQVCGFYSCHEGNPNGCNLSLCLVAIFFFSITFIGRFTIEPLFQLNEPFCWDSVKIGIYSAVRITLLSVTGIVSIKLLQKCVSEVGIILIGFTTLVCSFVVEGFASTEWMLLLVPFLGIFGLVPTPVLRSLMSRMVSPEHVGAIFSSIATVETLCQTFSAIFFTAVYNATLSSMSGAVFFVMGGSCSISVLLMICLCCKLRRESASSEVEIDVR